jgi:hypothetical protein
MATIDLRFSSHLAASRADVWAAVSTMAGVNDELRPFIRMTHPRDRQSLTDARFVPGELVFRSWLLAGGVLPVDRHSLVLERVIDGEGFDEQSTSWVQRSWRHERRVVDEGDGTCTLTDHLVAVPRVRLMRPVLAWAVAFLFRRRHRYLVEHFGAAAAT